MRYSYLIVFAMMCLGASSVYSNAKDFYDKGRYEYIRNNYFSAMEFYRQSLGDNPYFREAHIGMGEVFYVLKNYDNSLAYFKAAEQRFKDDVDIKLWLARVQMARKRFDSAQSYLLKALTIRPQDYMAYILFGDLFASKDDFNRAIEHYNKALLIDSKDDRAYLKIGRSYLSLAKPNKALMYLDKAYRINNRNPITNLYLGEYFKDEGSLATSEEYLQKALLLKPGYTQAMVLLYGVLFRLEKWNETKDILEKLLSLNKSNTSYYYHLGVVYEKLNKPYKSLSILLDGIKEDITNEALRYKAEEVFRKAYWTDKKVQEMGSSLVEYWHDKGNSYIMQNLSEFAIFSFRRGIRLNPRHIGLRFSLASFLKQQGFIDAYYRELKLIETLIMDSKSRSDKQVQAVTGLKKEQEKLEEKVKEEMLFAEYKLENTLSKKESIDQYKQIKISPKIALLSFEENKDKSSYNSISSIYKEVLYTALKMKDRLNVIFADDNVNQSDMVESKNVDFIIKGMVREEGDGIRVLLEIVNTYDGEIYRRFSLFQNGTSRLLSSALHLARKIEQSFPVFGSVIRKNYREVFLNVGMRHGYIIGDEFYVLRKQDITGLLQNKALYSIISNKSSLRHTLLSYKNNKQFGIDIIRITDIDENIAKGRLITSDFFDELNSTSFVIYVP